MRVARTVAELRAFYRNERGRGISVGFVPTMGALHEGHLSLVRRARDAADLVVVSLFVNPLQFGPDEDFDSYPRDEGKDLALAESEHVSVVFLPSVAEMYPEGAVTTVRVEGPLAETLEGASRPGHFDGVATVVAKLLNVVEPELAFFGQKDAQQVAVVRRMVLDLSWATEVVVGPTVREPDGLALSSRNAYLDTEQRTQATALFRALNAGKEELERGAGPDGAAVAMQDVLGSADGVDLDYAAAVDPYTFEDPVEGEPVLLAVAARVGATRLIDNFLVQP
ncbi:MAG: pantoate--beta-alanine ligase [Actinomycetota bacterium]|nr:pantoate--beta-alanine ligase [Actinomycetota bacterium]